MYIQYRPFMRQMLRSLSQHFELILYTSSDSDYANAVINAIEGTETFFQYRLTKENCVKVP